MARLLYPLIGLPALGAALYGAALAWLWFRQESLLFEPERLAPDDALATDPDTREFHVDVPGARLSVAQLKLPDPRGVVFYLHGNSGNLRKWFTSLDTFRALNFDVVMMDYRGFGKSTGRIESEAQLHADVRAVWNAIAGQYAGRCVVVSGQSLGTGLAAGLSADLCGAGTPADLTLLISPYSSMRALADEHYPWVPSGVLRYKLATVDHACKVSGPVMLVHGDRDELIGHHHSEAIRKALPQCQLLLVEGAGHGDVHQFPSFREGVATALGALAGLAVTAAATAAGGVAAAGAQPVSYAASGQAPTTALS
ncbi:MULTISPECIES: alpha/beta hydrolase [Ramlibacter]|uniref:Alpha/beta fold hydrolase n=1 Tax=Ramlibacter pinisoli TaxID=2682844 RepID=A0A6N8IQ94_9BURK|nr:MULTISPECIES: alpha/beta fold hydrolase [Ramlibacter]MBA2964051.1 alpha/beta fold hydrolase [Ramlibacter sp. CGMCC 1.13660]MVQ29017.1 alpha/beta fold hydrolase [Ramlibacter pinisoli]